MLFVHIVLIDKTTQKSGDMWQEATRCQLRAQLGWLGHSSVCFLQIWKGSMPCSWLFVVLYMVTAPFGKLWGRHNFSLLFTLWLIHIFCWKLQMRVCITCVFRNKKISWAKWIDNINLNCLCGSFEQISDVNVLKCEAVKRASRLMTAQDKPKELAFMVSLKFQNK